MGFAEHLVWKSYPARFEVCWSSCQAFCYGRRFACQQQRSAGTGNGACASSKTRILGDFHSLAVSARTYALYQRSDRSKAHQVPNAVSSRISGATCNPLPGSGVLTVGQRRSRSQPRIGAVHANRASSSTRYLRGILAKQKLKSPTQSISTTSETPGTGTNSEACFAHNC